MQLCKAATAVGAQDSRKRLLCSLLHTPTVLTFGLLSSMSSPVAPFQDREHSPTILPWALSLKLFLIYERKHVLVLCRKILASYEESFASIPPLWKRVGMESLQVIHHDVVSFQSESWLNLPVEYWQNFENMFSGNACPTRMKRRICHLVLQMLVSCLQFPHRDPKM